MDSGIQVSVDEETKSPTSKATLELSEFLSFAVFRLWYPKEIDFDDTVKPLKMALMPLPNKIKDVKVKKNVMIIAGTGKWYRQFVSWIGFLLQNVDIPSHLLYIALLYITRLRVKIDPEPSLSDEQKAPFLFQLLVVSIVTAHHFNSETKISTEQWASITGYDLPALTASLQSFGTQMELFTHVSKDQYKKWLQIIKILGKEHFCILAAVSMNEEKLAQLLTKRPDLVQEIKLTRMLNSTK